MKIFFFIIQWTSNQFLMKKVIFVLVIVMVFSLMIIVNANEEKKVRNIPKFDI